MKLEDLNYNRRKDRVDLGFQKCYPQLLAGSTSIKLERLNHERREASHFPTGKRLLKL